MYKEEGECREVGKRGLGGVDEDEQEGIEEERSGEHQDSMKRSRGASGCGVKESRVEEVRVSEGEDEVSEKMKRRRGGGVEDRRLRTSGGEDEEEERIKAGMRGGSGLTAGGSKEEQSSKKAIEEEKKGKKSKRIKDMNPEEKR